MKFPPLFSIPWLYRRLAWGGGAVLVLWLLLFLGAPPVIKSQIQQQATAALGRNVTVGTVQWHPWSLELTLTDLAVAGPGGQGEQLHVGRLYIDAAIASLWYRAPVLDAVVVEAPVMRLKRTAPGHYDIDDILARWAEAPAKAAAPSTEPARFALHNIQVQGGELQLEDQPVQREHRLSHLAVSLPFLSNLPSQREVRSDLHVAFDLNGSHFDSRTHSLPFLSTRATQAHLHWQALDVQPYLGYWPQGLSPRLRSGVLEADLTLDFEQRPAGPALRVQGRVEASGVRLEDLRQQELLSFERLHIGLEDVQPLQRRLNFSRLEWTAPVFQLQRNRQGQLNWASGRAPATAPEAPASSAAPSPGWQVQLGQLAIRGAQVGWRDETTAPAARLQLQDLTLEAQQLAWLPEGGVQPFRFAGATRLGTGQATAAADGPALRWSGTASSRQADVTATFSALPLELAAPYLAQSLRPRVQGQLDAEARLQWQAGANGQPGSLQVQLPRARLAQLSIRDGKAVQVGWSQLVLENAQIDLTGRSANLGQVSLVQPKVQLSRDADGLWMFQRWALPSVSAAAPAPAGPAAAPPWKLALQQFSLQGGKLAWDDASPAGGPVSFELNALQLRLRNWALAGRQPAALELSARMQAGQTEPGRIGYRGQLSMQPLGTQGQLDLQRLPVHALEPYFGQALNIDVLRADASFKGALRFASTAAGVQLKLSGDSALEDFQANSAGPQPAASAPSPSRARLGLGSELLSWKTLSLRGVEIALAPGQPAQVGVQETSLSDFFARIIVQANGRINLQDLVRQPPAAPAEAALATRAQAAEPVASASVPAPAVQAAAPAPAAAPVRAASGAADPAVADPAPPVIQLGAIHLMKGRVAFTDRFVKPNYSANLTDLGGTLGAFSNQPAADGVPAMADLRLQGRAEGTASLEILGKLNPLAKPLALDIQGRVRDLELPPLSPYSVKYAGHGIERGKLSVDVGYRIQPDGQLTASNQIILNQLSFGEQVEDAPASLPVKLAVALLADRNGVIDINLPISGSLSDPQFRLGPVIFKAVVNLIGKALLSPFSLLSSALGGGGEDMSRISFAPGSSQLSASARDSLDKVAQVLTNRPGLQMTVVGHADPASEREDYKRERLKALLLAEKRRIQLLGAEGSAVQSGTPTQDITPAEYPRLLKSLYQRSDVPKPRNLIGMAKDLPDAEMEALLLANLPVSEERLRELATQRGVAVRDYLASRQLPLDRLFLGAPKLGAAADPGSTGPSLPPARADLVLSAR